MKRLTKHWGNNYIPLKLDLECMFDMSGKQADYLQEIIKKLAEYEDLEEQGLLPKFHLGDEFWTVRCREVLKSKIVMLQQKKDGTWRYRFSQEISSKYHDTSDYEEKDYGKYFFNVKEEAEKLAEKEKKQWEEELKRLEEKRKKSTEAKGE